MKIRVLKLYSAHFVKETLYSTDGTWNNKSSANVANSPHEQTQIKTLVDYVDEYFVRWREMDDNLFTQRFVLAPSVTFSNSLGSLVLF